VLAAIRLLIDAASVEVFARAGTVVLSALAPRDGFSAPLQVRELDGIQIVSLRVSELTADVNEAGPTGPGPSRQPAAACR
jgi:hypothetical protein